MLMYLKVTENPPFFHSLKKTNNFLKFFASKILRGDLHLRVLEDMLRMALDDLIQKEVEKFISSKNFDNEKKVRKTFVDLFTTE